jgi:hypothetical protein
MRILLLPLLLLALPAVAMAGDLQLNTSVTDAKIESTPASAPTSFADADSLSQYYFPGNAWDAAYQSIEDWKKEYHLPITIGAMNWWHIDRNEHIYGDEYGVPGEQGTYRWYLLYDPEITIDPDGFLQSIGGHVQFRWRDGDKLRHFYPGNWWLEESYIYAKTKIGEFKAGEIFRAFGIPWDGTWWEGVAYFDGQRFNPNWGLSWENTWKPASNFSIDSTAQFFFAQSGYSASEGGALPETVPGLFEKNTGVVRVAPTWKLDKDSSIAWGTSGLYGGIDGSSRYGTSPREGAWETDLTYKWKGFSAFATFSQSYGALAPVNYVSGGPSYHIGMTEFGVAYKYGPITYRANFSKGWDVDPGGGQFLVDAGITAELAKNVTFYFEYVRWDVRNALGATSKFDDGFELILQWHF